MALGHQASPVFAIILSILNISNTLLVQPISVIKVASVCKLEGLHIDMYRMYTEHLLWSKAVYLNTLTYSIVTCAWSV